MNVSVSHARPNSAMAETIPARNTVDDGTSATFGRHTSRINVPTTNISISMIGVIPHRSTVGSFGTNPP